MNKYFYLKPINQYYKIIYQYGNRYILEKYPKWLTIGRKCKTINKFNLAGFTDQPRNLRVLKNIIDSVCWTRDESTINTKHKKDKYIIIKL